jgi:hypothetical protein
MINFHKLLNLGPKDSTPPSKETLLKAKIDFRINASDVSYNEINKVLVVYTNEENNVKSLYNIPSLLFLNFEYLDLNNHTVLFVFTNDPENTSVRMFINNNEVNAANYKTVIKIISFELLDSYFDKKNLKI